MVRIVLSGQSDIDLILQTVLPAHQYLTKPCEPEKLRAAIEQALKVRGIVSDRTVQALVSSMDSLPVLPQLYRDITDELNASDPSPQIVGRIIAKDVGMTAAILKVVHSSFFGFARHIATPEQAVVLLGLNTVRSLVLTTHIFSLFDLSKVPDYSLPELWDHCIRVSALARRICQTMQTDKEMEDNAGIAGMLHDVGKLIFAAKLTKQYNEILRIVRQENRLVWEVERDMLGVTHTEVGAYLMGLWGLPSPVVEAIAFHHAPTAAGEGFKPLTAVHAANVFDRNGFVLNDAYAKPELDGGYIQKLGLLDRIPEWEKAAASYFEEVRHDD